MSKVISLRLSDDLRAAIDSVSKKCGVTAALWCLQVLDDKINGEHKAGVIKTPDDAIKALETVNNKEKDKVSIPTGITMSMREAKALRLERFLKR